MSIGKINRRYEVPGRSTSFYWCARIAPVVRPSSRDHLADGGRQGMGRQAVPERTSAWPTPCRRIVSYVGPPARPTWQSVRRGSHLGAGRRRRSRSGRAWSMVGRGFGLGCRGRHRGRVRDQADSRSGAGPVVRGRFRRRRQARTDSILTSVRSIKPQKSNVSFPSVLGGPMSGSVTRRGWYSPTLKAMSSASLVDGFGPIPRSR